MKLSQGEKLILIALAAEKDGKEELDLNFIRSAILSGNTWALTWKFSGIPVEDNDPALANETADILAMWSIIESSVGKLTQEEREQLERDAHPFELKFSGFDGNNDPHYGVAHFLIEDMERFQEFKGRALNSHSQASLRFYRRMLPKYSQELRANGLASGPLSSESILRIVKPNNPDA